MPWVVEPVLLAYARRTGVVVSDTRVMLIVAWRAVPAGSDLREDESILRRLVRDAVAYILVVAMVATLQVTSSLES